MCSLNFCINKIIVAPYFTCTYGSMTVVYLSKNNMVKTLWLEGKRDCLSVAEQQSTNTTVLT